MKGADGKRILLLMSGSIAAAKASELISVWRKAGHRVRVMATEAALQFVGRPTLEGLSGEPVLSDTFAPGHAMAHIDWVRWADLIVLCPATANRLTGAFHGRADDLVGTALLAAEAHKPVLMVPAMNTHMWHQPAVQAAVEGLKQRGVTIMPPASGPLACGETGQGRLPEIAEILRFVQQRYLQNAAKRVLITAGGTSEAIDAVRVLSNRSTGHTGAALADAFSAAGHQVTLLHGENARQPRWPVQAVPFTDFDDLSQRLETMLSSQAFDLVLHAAAVSDYSLQQVLLDGQPAAGRKLSSQAERMTLELRRNPKLVDAIKSWSCSPHTLLVAFKLTASDDPAQQKQAVQTLLRRSAADWVVHNDQLQMATGQHEFAVFGASGQLARCANPHSLAETLQRLAWPAGGENTSKSPANAACGQTHPMRTMP